MIARLLVRLRDDRRGIATIEFAMWASMFFTGMLTAVDFGMWRTYQLRLSSAVEQGSILAFNSRSTLAAADATAIASYVKAAARLPAPGVVTATATCNGTATCTATGRTCACLSTGSTGANVFTAAASCGASCGTGKPTAGYYLTIAASYPYQATVIPSNLLNGKAMTDQVTVRLQ